MTPKQRTMVIPLWTGTPEQNQVHFQRKMLEDFSILFLLFHHYRDTTVQSLTLQPNVQDGVIIYEDSPLVSSSVFSWENTVVQRYI